MTAAMAEADSLEGDIRDLAAPTDEAQGLGGRYYFSPEIFQEERRRVFAPAWVPVAFESDLERPGDAFPVSFAGWELLIVRGEDGAVRGFHNVCRHRGMKLVAEKNNVRKIACPYHCWGYGLDGRLLTTPNIAGVGKHAAKGVRAGELSLIGVRTATWSGVVFVNIGGRAGPLEAVTAPIEARLAGYDLAVLESREAIGVLDLNANWKIFVEGGIEDYHLPYLHAATIGAYADNYKAEGCAGAWLGFSQRRRIEEARARYDGGADESAARLPVWPIVEKTGWADTLGIFLLPLGIVLLTPTMLSISAVLPRSPGRTVVRSKTWFIGEGATSPAFALARKASNAFFGAIVMEDIAAMECLQQMASVREDLGLKTRFSPHWEKSLHEFQQDYVERLTGRVATG